MCECQYDCSEQVVSALARMDFVGGVRRFPGDKSDSGAGVNPGRPKNQNERACDSYTNVYNMYRNTTF